MSDFADVMNQTYFEGKLHSDVVDKLRELPTQFETLCRVVELIFRRMQGAGISGESISIELAQQIVSEILIVLPEFWKGAIPPATIRGRHRALDTYVTDNSWLPAPASGVFVDIGCGFPPWTAIETAAFLPHWQVVGVEPKLHKYLVYTEDGDYAALNEEGEVQYFQAGEETNQRWREATRQRWRVLLRDPQKTREMFRDLFLRLRDDADDCGNARLVVDPIQDYETRTLRFIRGGIGDESIAAVAGKADVVRIFNVFIYYDREFRERAMRWLSTVLKPGGLCLCGFDWEQTCLNRCMVYRLEGDTLVAREFIFTLDNLVPGVFSWFSHSDDDVEAERLVHYVGILRRNQEFADEFDRCLRQIYAETGLCRWEDGRYTGPEPGIDSYAVRMSLHERFIDEGLGEKAVRALQLAGHDAALNSVGHVGVRVSDGTGSAAR